MLVPDSLWSAPAAIPDHPQAHVASSCGRPSGGLRSSRIPDANSPDRFGAVSIYDCTDCIRHFIGSVRKTQHTIYMPSKVCFLPSYFFTLHWQSLFKQIHRTCICSKDWEAAKRDLAAAGDLHLTPRSSMVSPEQRQRRRHTVGTPAAASEAYYTPAQQLSPAAHGPLPPPQGSAGRQRSPVQRQLVMDGAVAGGSAAAAAWWQSPSGSPPAAPYPSPAFREFPEAVFRVASGELAAAEARAAALERQPSSAGSFIAQLLSPEGGGNAADRVSPQLPQAARAAAESQIAAVAHANSLLQRLQSLASEAADASRLSCGEVPLAHGSSSGAGQTPQPSRCRRSRLSTASREPPTWALGDGSADAASCNLPQALRLIANSGDACLSSLGRRPPRPDSPLAAMQDAVAQMSATARRVRASTALPADGQLSPAGSGCSPTGLDGSAAARVTLKRAKMDMLSAARALAARSSEAQRLLSPVQPPLLSC